MVTESPFPPKSPPNQPFESGEAGAGSTRLRPAPADTGRAIRVGLWALGVGFGGFLLWAALAPLDEGVPSQGLVSIDTKRKAVQHLSGGIVGEVLVREGQEVRAGQVLLRLDGAAARASHESVRQRYLGLRAMQGRLLAEQGGLASISFHADLKAAQSDPLIAQQMATQEQLFQSRKAALRADLQAIEENLQGQQALLRAYGAMLDHRRSQLGLVSQELAGTRDLVKDGYAPRNRQLELERMVADSSAVMAELQGNSTRAERATAELRQRAIARQQEYRKEVQSQLADVTREAESDAEKLVSVRADLERVDIRSPADGQVMGLVVQTVGGVVAPGQKLMDVVPRAPSLLLEVRVAPQWIDKVRAGLPADIRFAAFAHAPQLTVEGRVVSVSADLLTDPQNPQMAYYLARVSVTPEGMKRLGGHQMLAGMPAEVVIKTGERTLLTYLLHPLTRRVAAALKEE